MVPAVPDAGVNGCRVLVVEDTYLLAADLVAALEGCGAIVLGPVASIAQARVELMAGKPHCAILDVNVRGQMVYEIATMLRTRNVPFVFATGYEAAAIDSRFGDVHVIQKPYESAAVVRTLGSLLGTAAEGSVR